MEKSFEGQVNSGEIREGEAVAAETVNPLTLVKRYHAVVELADGKIAKMEIKATALEVSAIVGVMIYSQSVKEIDAFMKGVQSVKK